MSCRKPITQKPKVGSEVIYEPTGERWRVKRFERGIMYFDRLDSQPTEADLIIWSHSDGLNPLLLVNQ